MHRKLIYQPINWLSICRLWSCDSGDKDSMTALFWEICRGLNIFENNLQTRLHPCISILESQAYVLSHSHSPVLWQVANRPSYPSDDQQQISNPRPPDPEASDRKQQSAVTWCRACTAQIGRLVWPRRARTGLLWAIPLISAGRDSNARFEGHTRPTCSLRLQLNVCFLGIC